MAAKTKKPKAVKAVKAKRRAKRIAPAVAKPAALAKLAAYVIPDPA
jgi:hypothetical protein